jgi:hypothetical protein
MSSNFLLDLSTVQGSDDRVRLIQHIQNQLLTSSGEKSTLSIKNGNADHLLVSEIVECALPYLHIVSFELDTVTIPIETLCALIESSHVHSLHLNACEVHPELNKPDAIRIVRSLASNVSLRTLTLKESSDLFARSIFTGLRNHTMLSDITVYLDSFECSKTTWMTLGAVFQSVPSLRVVTLGSIDWDERSFAPVALGLQNSFVSSISFPSCTFDKSSLLKLKSIFESATVSRHLLIDMDSPISDSCDVNTLIDMARCCKGLAKLSLWNCDLLETDEIQNLFQALAVETTTTSSVQELDLSPPVDGQHWSNSDLKPDQCRVLIEHLPRLKSLKRIVLSLLEDSRELKRDLLAAIIQNGSLTSYDVRIPFFLETDYDFVRRCVQRNKNLLNLLTSSTDESQVPTSLHPRLLHHAFETSIGPTSAFRSVLKMETVGKNDDDELTRKNFKHGNESSL